jgi:NADPH:quinone reductase-like Zn-dependent oxidoreductase
MRSLAISSYTTPDNYDVMDLPTPTIESPDEVLVKVHAASINPADVHMASGIAKLMQSASLVTRSLMNEEVLTGQVSTQNWV